jgi:NADP-dependent 3-hydroxy acid dehydrogenase YdfG/acyl carrier protein
MRQTEADGDPLALDPEGTVLITGATGVLGRLIARRLVTRHKARHLLLTSRRGAAADGAAELSAGLSELGAEVTMAACDVASLPDMAALLGSIPAEHPLTAVVHMAGMLDDATFQTLTEQQLGSVFRPKVDAALILDHLTRDLPLSAFVLFSSIAGTVGFPGQANYAAASAFLDGLAQRRRREGLPAVSLIWGKWEQEGGMTGELTAADRSRLSRGGITPLDAEEGVDLFDTALASGEAAVVPARVDVPALRTMAASGMVPSVMRGLVRGQVRRASSRKAATTSLLERLARASDAQGEQLVLDLVRGQIAEVLGHADPEMIEVDRAFSEMGFDSLAAVELRNRLNAATGLRLSATLPFDYPTAAALAEHLRQQISPAQPAGPARVDQVTEDREAAERIQAFSADEIFDFIDQELGRNSGRRPGIDIT